MKLRVYGIGTLAVVCVVFCVVAATFAANPTQSGNDQQLPFRGSYTEQTHAIVSPELIEIHGSQEGTATHLGNFRATTVDFVNPAVNTGTGTFDFTAADGDRLFARTQGGETEFIPPNESHVTLNAKIIGGTGRFANASGEFTVRFIEKTDFATATGVGYGSFEGYIRLNE